MTFKVIGYEIAPKKRYNKQMLKVRRLTCKWQRDVATSDARQYCNLWK